MSMRLVRDGIWSCGANDWERQTFDGLVPLPYGTSYNSYLVRGSQATALIDSVDPAKTGVLLQHLSEGGVDRLDFLIANHAEQDHSGAIPALLERYPDAKVVTNQKCADFLRRLVHLPEGAFQIIDDRDTLSLGDRQLEFILTPWCHWPETMVTFESTSRVLFSGDLFGAHLATSALFASEEPRTAGLMKSYYAQIMMPYGRTIARHLSGLAELNPVVLAPTHGPVHDQPAAAFEAYRGWTSNRVENKALVLFATMHGSTALLAERLADQLASRGIGVEVFDTASGDIGEIARASLEAATIVAASPIVLNGIHPALANALFVLNGLKPKARFAAAVTSYGWAGKASAQIPEMLRDLDAEFLPEVSVQGCPVANDFERVDALAGAIREKHAEAELV